jgi:hypothetical protein
MPMSGRVMECVKSHAWSLRVARSAQSHMAGVRKVTASRFRHEFAPWPPQCGLQGNFSASMLATICAAGF